MIVASACMFIVVIYKELFLFWLHFAIRNSFCLVIHKKFTWNYYLSFWQIYLNGLPMHTQNNVNVDILTVVLFLYEIPQFIS